jgi:hypothetical protein
VCVYSTQHPKWSWWGVIPSLEDLMGVEKLSY